MISLWHEVVAVAFLEAITARCDWQPDCHGSLYHLIARDHCITWLPGIVAISLCDHRILPYTYTCSIFVTSETLLKISDTLVETKLNCFLCYSGFQLNGILLDLSSFLRCETRQIVPCLAWWYLIFLYFSWNWSCSFTVSCQGFSFLLHDLTPPCPPSLRKKVKKKKLPFPKKTSPSLSCSVSPCSQKQLFFWPNF